METELLFQNVAHVRDALAGAQYICSPVIATVVFLAQATQKPVLVEGPAGVGKTELAKAVDRIAAQEDAFFSERFIQPRPLLQAISAERPVVLLIDEVDKSDPEFEAFLLEVLSDFQVSIPELGTRRARHIPFVFLTSNDSRDMSDALKRRCLHLHIDYPDRDLELRIVQLKLPRIGDGRCNYTHPEEGLLAQLRARCRRLIWLNPEAPQFWYTGDSEMRVFEAVCDEVRPCQNLNQLLAFITALVL